LRCYPFAASSAIYRSQGRGALHHSERSEQPVPSYPSSSTAALP